jgi:transposase
LKALNINGENYLKLLRDVVIPEINASEEPIIFQQDNALAYKKASVTAFLSEQNFETLEWPPQSPDLSPIEWVCIYSIEVPIIFQQDNAPAHKKASVTAFLSEQNFETLEWPPQSPDLSPIEWVWIILKMKALKPRPTTPATMREAILEIWDNLDDLVREKTIDTFRKRLRQCIERKRGLLTFNKEYIRVM